MEAVRLDLFSRSHLGVIHELADDPDVQRFTRFPRALRLELLISDQNPASSKVAVRSGYQRDAILRFLYLKDGVRCDTEIWSRLPSDP